MRCCCYQRASSDTGNSGSLAQFCSNFLCLGLSDITHFVNGRPSPFLILHIEDRNFYLRRCRQVHFVAGAFRPLSGLCCGYSETAHYLALSSLHDSSTTVISQHGQLVPNRSERGCVWAPKRLQAFNLAHHQCTFLTEIWHPKTFVVPCDAIPTHLGWPRLFNGGFAEKENTTP